MGLFDTKNVRMEGARPNHNIVGKTHASMGIPRRGLVEFGCTGCVQQHKMTHLLNVTEKGIMTRGMRRAVRASRLLLQENDDLVQNDIPIWCKKCAHGGCTAEP